MIISSTFYPRQLQESEQKIGHYRGLFNRLLDALTSSIRFMCSKTAPVGRSDTMRKADGTPIELFDGLFEIDCGRLDNQNFFLTLHF